MPCPALPCRTLPLLTTRLPEPVSCSRQQPPTPSFSHSPSSVCCAAPAGWLDHAPRRATPRYAAPRRATPRSLRGCDAPRKQVNDDLLLTAAGRAERADRVRAAGQRRGGAVRSGAGQCWVGRGSAGQGTAGRRGILDGGLTRVITCRAVTAHLVMTDCSAGRGGAGSVFGRRPQRSPAQSSLLFTPPSALLGSA